MGLDVMVFRETKLADKKDELGFIADVPFEGQEHKVKNLQRDKGYTGVIAEAQVSYSYSSHGVFRETLLRIIGREDIFIDSRKQIDWSFLSTQRKMPFYELIYFSDCEGCMDWEISATLYNDFLKYKTKAIAYFDKHQNQFFKDIYQDWISVFKAGKEKGSVVVFA